MKFNKTVLHRMNMPYAVGCLGSGPEYSVVAATEDHGQVVRIDPPYVVARELVAGPGGCMFLVGDPERPSDLYAVMGCFPIFKFREGAIYRIRVPRVGDAEAVRLLDLPFGHRIGLARRGEARYLFAASLAADKKDAADWTLPGGLFAARLDGIPDSALTLLPVLPGIHKNHGFLLAELEGRASLLIGGSEGLISVDLQSTEKGWPSRQILAQETSEAAVFDLDGDGEDEIATIEPFHGNALRVYKRSAKGWSACWDAELEYGHCVMAGMFEGRRSIIVSNRAGSKDLLLFQFEDGGAIQPRRLVIDAGAAAANMIVVSHGGQDRLFSANQAAGEVVVYSASAGS